MLLVNLVTPHITLIPLVNLITLVILFVGAISSDLYRPQSQDETVEFSFFVALSYEYNLQLGCLWWKISTSSLKTYFTNLALTFVNLVSRHENCNFPRFTWWKVNERGKMHWVTHIFITDYKKPSFSKIGQHLCAPEVFLWSVPFSEKHRSHGWTPQLRWP